MLDSKCLETLISPGHLILFTMSRLTCDMKISIIGRPAKHFNTMGYYDTKTGKSTLFLGQIWNYLGGEGITHNSLVRAISELQCHEVLHRMIHSGSPSLERRVEREHKSITSLMKAAGMKHIYIEK